MNDAIDEFSKAIEIREELVNRQGRTELGNALAMAYMNKGSALEQNNDSVNAIAMFSLAIGLWEQDLQSGFIHNLPHPVKAFRLRIKSLIKLKNWQNIADDAVKSLVLFTTFTQDKNLSEYFKQQICEELGEILRQLKRLSESNREKILLIADEFEQKEAPRVLFGAILRKLIERDHKSRMPETPEDSF